MSTLPEESSISAVSWGAIAAGAVVSAAFSAALGRFDGARRSAAPTFSTNTGGDYSSRDISRTASRGAAEIWSLSKYTNTSGPTDSHFLTYAAQRSSVLFG